jgi:hypothetical protein
MEQMSMTIEVTTMGNCIAGHQSHNAPSAVSDVPCVATELRPNANASGTPD